MKIALLLPINLEEFQSLFPDRILPKGYPYPLFVPLVKYYLALGHHVTICTYDRNINKSQIFESDKLTIFIAKSFRHPKISALLQFRYESSQISMYLKSHPCDIYHAHWSYEFAMAALAVDERKTLITVHDWPPYIYEVFNDYYRRVKLKISNTVFKKGQYFSTVSEYMKELFLNSYPDKRIELIPNFLEFDKKSVVPNKELNIDNPVIISINNGFDNRKNTTTLMLAFQKILTFIPSAKLKMFGYDYESGGIAEKWAIKHNCASNIVFVGPIPHNEIMKELWRADLLIHTSKEESFGMIFLEAMLQKTPVIAGKNSGAAPWILNYGIAGVLVNISDPYDISNFAIAILQDKKKWNELSKNGFRRVLDFTLNNTANLYLDYYAQILRKL